MEGKKRKITYSNREIEIINLISKGFTNREIAVKIGNSYSYVCNTFNKLLIKTRTVNKPHLVSWAYNKGILPVREVNAEIKRKD